MSRIASQVTLATIGDYQILKVIGSGSTSTVYQGKHPSTGAVVAIKVIPGRVVNDPILRMRFAKECHVARKLDHPNVVRVLDFGLDGDKPFLVMEHVNGGSLGQRLKKEGRLAEREAVAIITQAGKALQWAHKQRLVHRDVKPDNILLDADGQAKLTDFGLVKTLDDDCRLTQPLDYLGTPNFMAPEQFQASKNADALCDLYSLAATLYMTVTGQVPFQAANSLAIATVFKKKLEDNIAPPRQLVTELSERLSNAIMQALKVDRKKRQASVQVFIDSLGAPSAAQPETMPPALAASGDGRATREKRAKKRFPCRRPTTCEPLRGPCSELWTGQVVDISQTGLCLKLNRRFERGAMLKVVLEDQPTARTAIACVVWIQQLGPSAWKLGCRFANPLSEVDLQLGLVV
jgi:serine/threonine protein kinase